VAIILGIGEKLISSWVTFFTNKKETAKENGEEVSESSQSESEEVPL
jgi:hypothetical protein